MPTRPLAFTLSALLAASTLGLVAMAQETRQPPAPKPGEQAPQPGQQPGRQGRPGGPGGAPGERGPGGPGGPGGGQDRQQNIEGAMKGIQRAFRALKETVDQPASKEANLKLINDMQRGIVVAKGIAPKTDKIAEDKKADHIKAYRTTQLQMLKLLIELEEQTMDGKTKEAKATCDKVEKLEDEAHKKFGGEEDHKPAPAGK